MLYEVITLMGPFQAFRRAPATTQVLDFFREALGTPAFLGATGDPIGMPIFSYYYQALTLHGVLNALVFTTFFIVGFSYFTTQRRITSYNVCYTKLLRSWGFLCDTSIQVASP